MENYIISFLKYWSTFFVPCNFINIILHKNKFAFTIYIILHAGLRIHDEINYFSQIYF